MPITPQQILNAKQVQDLAAHDVTQTVRLVAGPGTGKSFVIEERVFHLLHNLNVDPHSIIVVSFTRASAKDLRDRIYSFCHQNHQNNYDQVRVSTLHSLALYLLKHSGNLNLFAVDPVILDDWETENVFDAEFGNIENLSPTRSSEIRRDYEAYWSTGVWGPANLPPITTPVTQVERTAFLAHYSSRTQAYCCVLPGEVIRTCVTQIQGGHIDPVNELGAQYLIVDEVQDLNPCDFEFINLLIQLGVNVFICGDDDQSIYSFRYAFPFGIQNFTAQYPNTSAHVLQDCFRCTPNILTAAMNVITAFPAPNRIQKNLASVYLHSTPALTGFISGNIFNNPASEAAYIGRSCRALIMAGVSPKDILILVNNKRFQLSDVKAALTAENVDFDAFSRDDFKDSDYGRFIVALIRVLEESDDYIAHRILLSTPRGCGIASCTGISQKTVTSNLNFKSLFYQPLPNGIFNAREVRIINKAIGNIQAIQNWALDDEIGLRLPDLLQMIQTNFGAAEEAECSQYFQSLPTNLTLSELKDLMQTDSQEAKDSIISAAIDRTGNQPAQLQPQSKVKVLSYHSSKGLSAKVVFLPGLEEGVFPNARMQQIPGLVLEGARLMYVAITRAKAACIMSYCRRRNIYGQNTSMTASRYCVATGVQFAQQANASLTGGEVQTIQHEINNL